MPEQVWRDSAEWTLKPLPVAALILEFIAPLPAARWTFSDTPSVVGFCVPGFSSHYTWIGARSRFTKACLRLMRNHKITKKSGSDAVMMREMGKLNEMG